MAVIPNETHHHLMALLIPAEMKLYTQLFCLHVVELSQQHVLTPTGQLLRIIIEKQTTTKSIWQNKGRADPFR